MDLFLSSMGVPKWFLPSIPNLHHTYFYHYHLHLPSAHKGDTPGFL